MKLVGLLLSLCLVVSPVRAEEPAQLSFGQHIYLPIYSHMLYGNRSKTRALPKALLSALVSIRNTDPKRSLRVLSARYYDTHGKFLQAYISGSVVVAPFATAELFVDMHDESGGSGANFLIRWESDAPMNPPLIEALHANMDSGKAVILTTRGVPLRLD